MVNAIVYLYCTFLLGIFESGFLLQLHVLSAHQDSIRDANSCNWVFKTVGGRVHNQE